MAIRLPLRSIFGFPLALRIGPEGTPGGVNVRPRVGEVEVALCLPSSLAASPSLQKQVTQVNSHLFPSFKVQDLHAAQSALTAVGAGNPVSVKAHQLAVDEFVTAVVRDGLRVGVR